MGSAVALQRAFGGELAAPAGVSAAGRRLLLKLDAALIAFPDPARFGRVVVVDTSTRVQLGALGERLKDFIVVDHHAYGDLAGDAALLVHAPRASCAEVVLALLEKTGRPIDATSAYGLLAGLVADTARFRFGDAASLAAAARLAALHGLSVPAVLETLDADEEDEDPRDVPRRHAKLVAAQRADVALVRGLVVARTRVSSFEAAAALGLVRLGADLALAAAERREGTRVSARASPALVARGAHLGRAANRAARALGAAALPGEGARFGGGGHEAAAGLNAPVPAEDAVAAFEREIFAEVFL